MNLLVSVNTHQSLLTYVYTFVFHLNESAWLCSSTLWWAIPTAVYGFHSHPYEVDCTVEWVHCVHLKPEALAVPSHDLHYLCCTSYPPISTLGGQCTQACTTTWHDQYNDTVEAPGYVVENYMKFTKTYVGETSCCQFLLSESYWVYVHSCSRSLRKLCQ